jgi:DNA polymerase III delta prime subunit
MLTTTDLVRRGIDDLRSRNSTSPAVDRVRINPFASLPAHTPKPFNAGGRGGYLQPDPRDTSPLVFDEDINQAGANPSTRLSSGRGFGPGTAHISAHTCGTILCTNVHANLAWARLAVVEHQIDLSTILHRLDETREQVRRAETSVMSPGFTESHRSELLRLLADGRQQISVMSTETQPSLHNITLASQRVDHDARQHGITLESQKVSHGARQLIPRSDLVNQFVPPEDSKKYLPRIILHGIDDPETVTVQGETLTAYFGDDRALNIQAYEAGFTMPDLVTTPIPSKNIIGAKGEKQFITEQFIASIKFRNMQYSKNTLLLYGPPGTGKSYIATAIPTLFNEEFPKMNADHARMYTVSASALRSRRKGQTEKRITLLSKWLARVRDGMHDALQQSSHHQPPIIFLLIDDLDQLFGDTDTAAISAALLPLLDPKNNELDNIVVIGTTNLPWMLDPAIVSGFEKASQVFVDLPDQSSRVSILRMMVYDKIGDTNPDDPYSNACDVVAGAAAQTACRRLDNILIEIVKERMVPDSTQWSEAINKNFTALGDEQRQQATSYQSNHPLGSDSKPNTVNSSPFGFSAGDVKNAGRAIIALLAKLTRERPRTSGGVACVLSKPTHCDQTPEKANDVQKSRVALYKLQGDTDEAKFGQLCVDKCLLTQEQYDEYTIRWEDVAALDPEQLKTEINSVLSGITSTVDARNYCRMLYYTETGKMPVWKDMQP